VFANFNLLLFADGSELISCRSGARSAGGRASTDPGTDARSCVPQLQNIHSDRRLLQGDLPRRNSAVAVLILNYSGCV